MKNLKEETLEIITDNDQSVESIRFVGVFDRYTFDVTSFLNDCDFSYDDGYGSAAIDPSLVIVFKDGSWLERGEYDGSEWWEYKMTPKLPTYEVDIIGDLKA